MGLNSQTPRSPFAAKMWTLMRRFLVGAAVLFLVLALAGAIYQVAATSRDMRRFAPPGKMVTVQDHRVHALLQGEGVPTVVFDAPVGASSLGWALVQPEVVKFTSTLAYDRAGYGWSEPGPRPQSSGRIVGELHELLEQSHLPKPYILVGASLGGCNARLYAFRYPREVAGLVLVDSAHEEQFNRAPPEKPSVTPLRIFQLASRLGIMRLAGMPVDIAGMGVLKPGAQAAAEAVGYRTSAVDAIVAETAAIEQSFAEVRQGKASAGTPPWETCPYSSSLTGKRRPRPARRPSLTRPGCSSSVNWPQNQPRAGRSLWRIVGTLSQWISLPRSSRRSESL